MSDPYLLVSVPIITYNHEPYIAEAIESVLAQITDFDIEIIIGEDCSTDDTGRIVTQYAHKYKEKIRVITSKENVGIIANITRTEKACRGKYIAYLEGDDYWSDPNKLQLQVDFLESHPDYGLVFGDRNEYFQKNGKLIKAHNKYYGKKILSGDIFDEVLIRNFIPTCTVCLRRELLQRYFDYDYLSKQNLLIHDLPKWLDIAANSKIGYIDKPLATYRVLEDSISHASEKKSVLHWFESMHKARLYYIRKYNRPQQTEVIVLNNYYKGLLELAYWHRDHELALHAYPKLKQRRDRDKRTRMDTLAYYLGTKNLLFYFLGRLYLKVTPSFEGKRWPPGNRVVDMLIHSAYKVISYITKRRSS
jgi:glycosyltransferase involved in cell wall biosynthesis